MIDLNLRPQEPIVSTWLLYHSICFAPVVESLSLYCNQEASPPLLCKTDGIYATPMQTAGVSATPVQLGGVSAITRTISATALSLRQSNFSSLVLQKCPIYLIRGQLYILPNQLYAQIKRLYAWFKNPFCRPGLGMINSLSCRAINPESHFPWEGKSKSVVNRVKGWLTS